MSPEIPLLLLLKYKVFFQIIKVDSYENLENTLKY